MWENNTVGRKHRRGGGHAAADHVQVCCSIDVKRAPLYYGDTDDHMDTRFRPAPNVTESRSLCTVNSYNSSISLR